MDPNRFDAIARALDTRRSRRGALLGGVLGALGIAGLSPDLDAAGKHQRKRNRKQRRKSNRRCIDCADRALTRGADLRGCDLSGRDLSGADLRSADLDGACLQRADLTSADLNSADFENADVRGANFTDANLDRADIRGWRSDDAIFCRTTMPDGETQSANCLPGGGATCLGLNQLCSPFGGLPCCDYGTSGNTFCDGTLPFITACQSHCRTDADCQRKMGTRDVYCANDPVSDFGCAGRNFDPNVHCCGRKTCDANTDCQSGNCCQITDFFWQCCLEGETCLRGLGGCVR